jgi:acyl-coenzyme A thioesterase PaaI-like protein
MFRMMLAIQDTYPADHAHCYGCGRYNEHGLRIKTYAQGTGAVTDHVPEPIFTGGTDSAYGGLIASIIDCHSAGAAAIFWMDANRLEIGRDPTPRFVTARLEVDYLAPTPLAPWRVIGTADEVRDRKVVVGSEVTVGGEVTARGRAVMVRI